MLVVAARKVQKVTLRAWCDERGVMLGTAKQWRHRYDDFPDPVEVLRPYHFYDRAALTAWHTSAVRAGRIPAPKAD
jgi:hypothetical protein